MTGRGIIILNRSVLEKSIFVIAIISILLPFLQVFTRKLVYGTDMIPESLENSGFPAIATD